MNDFVIPYFHFDVLMLGWGFDNSLRISKIIIHRKCKCFKRDRESEDENLTISTQFQHLLDDMSTDEDSENSDSSHSTSSENNLSEIDDVDYYF